MKLLYLGLKEFKGECRVAISNRYVKRVVE